MLTLMREAAVPPPMCSWQIEFPAVVDQVDFMACSDNHLSVLIRGGKLYSFEWTREESWEPVGDSHEGLKIVRREGKRWRPILVSVHSVPWRDMYHFRRLSPSLAVACYGSRLEFVNLDRFEVTVQ